MNYTFLYLSLATLSCSAMEEATLTKELTNQMHKLDIIGGIQSLCSAKKDNKEIVIIGYARSEEFVTNPLSQGDAQAKDWIIPQLEQWSTLETPTALITFDSKKACEDHMKKHEESAHNKSINMPLHAEINTLAALTNYKLRNLHIIPITVLVDYDKTMWNVSPLFNARLFSHLARQSNIPHSDAHSLNKTIKSFSTIEQKRYFSKSGSFSLFKKAARKTLISSSDDVCTIEKYFKILNHMTKETEDLLDQTNSRFLKKELTRAINRLKRTHAKATSYLNAYGITDDKTGLMDALFAIITHNRELITTLHTFTREIYEPICEAIDLYKHASIVNTTNTYKQVVILLSYENTHDLIAFLDASGFSIEAKGYLPVMRQGNTYQLSNSPFTKIDALSFLQSRFGGSSFLTVPKISPDSPIAKLLKTSTNTMASSILSLFTEEKSTPLEEPTFTYEKESITCRFCSQAVEKKETQPFNTCSFHCLTKQLFLKKAKSLKKILSKKEHNEDEDAILNHLGALCYLRSYTLSPLALTPISGFPLKKTVQLLTKLIKKTNYDQTWTRTLAIAKKIHIDSEQLLTFCKKYQDHITKHRASMKKYKSTITNKNFMPPLPVFDPEEILAKAQEAQHNNLDSVFLLEKQNTAWYPRIYSALMNTLKFNPSQLAKALTIIVKQETNSRSVEDILKDF